MPRQPNCSAPTLRAIVTTVGSRWPRVGGGPHWAPQHTAHPSTTEPTSPPRADHPPTPPRQSRTLHQRVDFFTIKSISVLQSRFLYYRNDAFTTEPTYLPQSRRLYYRADFVTTEPISWPQGRFLCDRVDFLQATKKRTGHNAWLLTRLV